MCRNSLCSSDVRFCKAEKNTHTPNAVIRGALKIYAKIRKKWWEFAATCVSLPIKGGSQCVHIEYIPPVWRHGLMLTSTTLQHLMYTDSHVARGNWGCTTKYFTLKYFLNSWKFRNISRILFWNISSRKKSHEILQHYSGNANGRR